MSQHDFENYLLGHCLDDNLHFLEATEIVSAQDFALSAHQVVFRAIASVLDSGKTAEIYTVGEYLAKHNQIEAIGGIGYLVSLTDGLIRGRKSIRDYAESVKADAQRRRLVALTERISIEGLLPSSDLDDLLSQTEDGCLFIRGDAFRSTSTSVKSAVQPLIQRMDLERTRKGDLLGLPTGIASLDTLSRGFQPGELTVVGARTGTGKTSFGTQAVIENCQAGTPVMVFSLEMTAEQNLRRIFAAVSGVSFPRVRDTKFANEPDMAAIAKAATTVADWPLQIVDDSAITIEKLTARARLAVRRDGVRLIVVDYAQIVSATGRDERLRVAAVSRGLTRLAKDENVPVIVLSQLARGDRANPNRRPAMSDLRESSQLENDAHVVILLHREWDEANGRLSDDAELIVAKQRSGETGVLPVTFNRRSLLFEKRSVSAPAEVPYRRTANNPMRASYH